MTPVVRAGDHVAVCGGGLAGLAAATVLAEARIRVTLFERETFLGGRAGAWTDQLSDGTTFQMERGFHAFFRHYDNLRALMRRVDPELSFLAPMNDYPILGPDGREESFCDLPTRAPWNVAELVRRTPTLGFRDLAAVRALWASAMLSFGPHTYARWDRISAKEYLDSLNFPPRARQMLFEVFAHSFFNPETHFSAAELLMQFHFYFLGNREGLVFDTMKTPFSTGLMDPLRRYLENHGVTFKLGADVHSVGPGEVRAGERHEVDAVVLALSVPGLRAVAERSSLDAATLRRIASLEVTWPFVVWRLWLDRRVDPSRAPFAGTAGIGLLDNISVYEKLEDESRAWAEANDASVVELHAYAVPPELDEGAIRRDLLAGLHALYPETRGARIREDRFFRRQDCPAFPPGSDASRPGVRTGDRRVVLAGDFVRLSQPSALMERAVTSGFLAANTLLGRNAEAVHSPSRRGLLSALAL
ncbi:MAG: FAD-dependent oxidoreductase [Myxococcota bacterium]